MNQFFSNLQDGLKEEPQLPAVVEDVAEEGVEPVDFFNQTAKQLVVKAHSDYMELSEQIQSGIVDPQVIHGAAAVLASTNALLDTINKRELQKERFEQERWKIERTIEGRKEVDSHKATVKTTDAPKTLIQNNTIHASREEVMKLLKNADNIVQDAEVEILEDIKEI